MAAKPMPGEQLEIRLSSLIQIALGSRGPGLNTSTTLIADVLVDTACCAPGRSGVAVINNMITRMRSRLDEHGSNSST
jgi:hypothetical protein